LNPIRLGVRPKYKKTPFGLGKCLMLTTSMKMPIMEDNAKTSNHNNAINW